MYACCPALPNTARRVKDKIYATRFRKQHPTSLKIIHQHHDLEPEITMPPLISGSCDTCGTDHVKLRTNPFDGKEQCEDCRAEAIIGITDIKSQFKLKDGDLKGLKMVTEPQPAFLGGPDRRWYLVEEVEKRAKEVEKKVGQEAEKKVAAKKEKEAAKQAKENAKIEKASAKKDKQVAKDAQDAEEEKFGKPKDAKRKRNAEPDQEAADADEEVKPPVKRGRGRPPGGAAKKAVAKTDGKPKPRGRPRKAKPVEE